MYGVECQLHYLVSRRHKSIIVELFFKIDGILPKDDNEALSVRFRAMIVHGWKSTGWLWIAATLFGFTTARKGFSRRKFLTIKPLYLLADSQLLFRQGDKGVRERIRADLPSTDPTAAYIGASNGDNPEFYGLFTAAMEIMGLSRFRMVPARLTDEHRAFLQEADLIVLAGGDVELGWHAFEQNGVKNLISRKRYEGSVLVGVSAGALQLGLGALTQAPQPKILSTFGFAPFYVGAHAERDEWFDLRALVNLSKPGVRGIGIPAGGGAIYWPDGTLEPVRKPLIEFVRNEEQVSEGLILPSHPAGGV